MRKVLVLVLLALPVAASADVLYDSLFIADQQIYCNGNGNAISGMGMFGYISDLQAADDFPVPDPGYYIDTVTVDHATFMGLCPADGVLVEFFEDPDHDCIPNEAPIASVMAAASCVGWNETIFGLVGVRVTATLPFEEVALPAGEYFVSAQPVDLSAGGDWYYSVVSCDLMYGCDRVGRDGAQDHGNNYAGGYGTFDWFALGGAYPPPGDLSMQVTGHEIPEPASLVLLGLAGLLLRRR